MNSRPLPQLIVLPSGNSNPASVWAIPPRNLNHNNVPTGWAVLKP